MVGLSPYGEGQILTPLVTTAYVSLHTADPGITGTSEVSTTGTNYGRQGPVGFTNSGSEPTTASNTLAITYGVASSSWGTISYFGIWDAATGGNFRGSGSLSPSKAINSGDTARFAALALTITAQ